MDVPPSGPTRPHPAARIVTIVLSVALSGALIYGAVKLLQLLIT